jgi:hypothetical protein
MSAETDHILDTFRALLAVPTGDGKNKRDAGTKVHWTIDQTHKDAMLRHLGRWWNGEREDADSGAHPLVHLAWRALAVAWQETNELPADFEIPGQQSFDEFAGAGSWQWSPSPYSDAAASADRSVVN